MRRKAGALLLIMMMLSVLPDQAGSGVVMSGPVLTEQMVTHNAVILVPSVIGLTPDSWAQPGRGRTLYDDLVTRGFKPERHLFTLRRSGAEDEEGMDIDIRSLQSMIRRAYELAGDQPVDIITHGEGAVLVKAALTGTSLPVRNVVAVSPPHRGSYNVHEIRVAHEQEAYLSLEQGQRGLPAHPLVVNRATKVFEPLYHEYVMGHLLNPQTRLIDFDQWLIATHADKLHGLFTNNCGRGPCDVLTQAYYNLLALNAARYRYAYGQADRSALRLMAAIQPVFRLLQVAVHPIVSSVLDVLGNVIVDVGYRWQTTMHSDAKLLRPLAITDQAVLRMYPDKLEHPFEFTANGWLSSVNGRRGSELRWVTVIPTGDGLVSVGAVTEPGIDDFSYLFTGPGRTDHHRVMSNRALWQLLCDHLELYPRRTVHSVGDRFRLSTSTSTTSWIPVYTELTADPMSRELLDVDIAISSAGTITAWVDIYYGDAVPDRRLLVPDRDGTLTWRVSEFGVPRRCVIGYRSVDSESPVPVVLEVTAGTPADTEYERPDSVPYIVVHRSTKRTTLEQPQTTVHRRWEWDFGDGNILIIDGAQHTALDISHEFTRPGMYDVSAVSFDNWGRVLCNYSWIVDGSDKSSGFSQLFSVASIADPALAVTIDGPSEWLAGLPAEYRVSVVPDLPPGVIRQSVRVDPGPEFIVQWPRPGVFPVTVAVIVERTYVINDREVTTKHVSLHSRSVVVLGTSVRD